MVDLLNPLLLAPIGATIIATIGTIIVYLSFRSQSWGVKTWLIIFMASWIPWAGTTVLMRLTAFMGLTPEKEYALIFLRISFISLQIAYFSLYRFHHLLVFKTTDRRGSFSIMTIIVGFNIAMGFNEKMLHVNLTGEYYTDQFSLIMQLTNLLGAGWAGRQAFIALRELDVFSSFYTPEGKRKSGQIFLALFILILTFVILILWILDQNEGVAPDATLFIFFSWVVLGYFTLTYGLRPLSTILSPQRIWAFILINADSGIPIFTKVYGDGEEQDYILFSGAVNAANTMLRFQLNSPSSIDLVSLDDRAVMMNTQGGLHFCLVVDHNSAQFEVLLNEIVRYISRHPEYQKMDTSDPTVDTRFINPILAKLLEV